MTATVESVHLHGPTGTEAPLTLQEPAPKVLSFADQLGLWSNLGVSILGPVGAIFVLAPGGAEEPWLPIGAALLAIVVGTLLGTALVGLAAIPGAQTGAPSMVLLRGLFGARTSYVPTVLNVVQLLGWGTFEIVAITAAVQQLLPWHGVRWPYVVVAGVLTTVMAIRPLGSVRVLRRYAVVAVAIATVYLFGQLLTHHVTSPTKTSMSGFWTAADYVVAVAVSFVPLASDYSRHSRSVRSAFTASFVGYSVTQIAYYALGVLALVTVVHASDDAVVMQHDMFGAFIAVPVGWLAFGVLTLRELDQSFADAYSTVVSTQNIWPRVDRRIFALVVGAVATGCALWLDIGDYANFLSILGSVFVPMFAVFAVDYFVLGGKRSWNTTPSAPPRWSMLVPWLLGFVMYQLVYAPDFGPWATWWGRVAEWVHFSWQPWMSASVLSFAVAALFAVPFGIASRRRTTRSGGYRDAA
jgi:putative hydroxymethylpyrimidine transporter CytX